MYKTPRLIPGLTFQWECVGIHPESFAKPRAQDEPVVHIKCVAKILDKDQSWEEGRPVDVKSPVSPSHYTFSKAEIEGLMQERDVRLPAFDEKLLNSCMQAFACATAEEEKFTAESITIISTPEPRPAIRPLPALSLNRA